MKAIALFSLLVLPLALSSLAFAKVSKNAKPRSAAIEASCVDAIRKIDAKLLPAGECGVCFPHSLIRINGDGFDVLWIKKQVPWGIVVFQGSGDCLSGCMEKTYRYFSCDPSSRAVVEIPNGRAIDLWGIPGRHLSTSAKDMADLKRQLKAKDWWVRGRALAVLIQLLKRSEIAPQADEDSRQHFDQLRSATMASETDYLKSLEAMKADRDPDVAKVAKSCSAFLKAERKQDGFTYETSQRDSIMNDTRPHYLFSEEFKNCERDIGALAQFSP